MEAEDRGGRLRSFVAGSLLGASAALAAGRRKRPRRSRKTPAGLAAFESAPCFQETLERERREADAEASR